ncbi:hypothetical protein MSAN_01517800 [Mycena sanguinolenta]|uniref:DUF6534 domain-containing protein n=1 Tax=Mycena sanguinolenta TaxID=230812 RepID=A0A8H6Y379_9AGAR|nr:hypothetical protein MSAN_01517800 [Mycena sanguinolenta]
MDPFASFNPNPTLGALQIGVLVSAVLFGVATMQTYIYFTRFPEDSRKMKALTVFVWACDVAHVISFGHLLYTWTITDYGQPERLFGVPPKSLSASTFFSGLTPACVQSFFAFRIYAFTKKAYIPSLIWFMAFLHLLGRVVLFGGTLHASSIAVSAKQWEWLITTIWCLSVVADVVITTTMVVVLRAQRSYALRSTAAVMDKLIVWTIETGMITSASSIIVLACFVAMKGNFIWLAFHAVSMQLFSNSLLANLNSRAALRTQNSMFLESIVSITPPYGVHVETVRQVAYSAEPLRKTSG